MCMVRWCSFLVCKNAVCWHSKGWEGNMFHLVGKLGISKFQLSLKKSSFEGFYKSSVLTTSHSCSAELRWQFLTNETSRVKLLR